MQSIIESNDADFYQHWHTLLNNDPVQDPLYGSFSGTDEKSSRQSGDYQDRSFLIISENQPVFGCSVTLHIDQWGQKCLGYFGLDAYTHVNSATLSDASNNFCPEAIRLLQQHIEHLLEKEQPEAIDYLDPVSCGIMSPVTQVLLEKGALPTVQKVQLIDLNQSRSELFAQVSKECEQNIRWADGNIQTSVFSNDASEVCKEQSAVDYSIHTDRFYNYLEILNRGQGFLVQACLQKKLVASALFVHSNRTCQHVYSDLLQNRVGPLPGKALLHQIIWQGILEGKARGCELFDFGCHKVDSSVGSLSVISPEDFGGMEHTRLRVSHSSSGAAVTH